MTIVWVLVICGSSGGRSDDHHTELGMSRMMRAATTTRSLPWFPEFPGLSRTQTDKLPKEVRRPVVGSIKWVDKNKQFELTLGREDGLKEGDELDAFRGGSISRANCRA